MVLNEEGDYKDGFYKIKQAVEKGVDSVLGESVTREDSSLV
jgi:HEPN domain-containing protein